MKLPKNKPKYERETPRCLAAVGAFAELGGQRLLLLFHKPWRLARGGAYANGGSNES
jgi:hypothetical protein